MYQTFTVYINKTEFGFRIKDYYSTLDLNSGSAKSFTIIGPYLKFLEAIATRQHPLIQIEIDSADKRLLGQCSNIIIARQTMCAGEIIFDFTLSDFVLYDERPLYDLVGVQ